MSQLADITSTFQGFQKKYGWTTEETAQNFLEVLDDLEWELDWSEPPRLPGGRIDYVVVMQRELDLAKKYFE